MRLCKRRVLCLLGLLGLASLVLCMQTLYNYGPKVPLRRSQVTVGVGHQRPLPPHSKSQTTRLNSVEIMESNLNHLKAKSARKKPLKAVVRLLGNDNNIVELPEAARNSALFKRKANSGPWCPQLGWFDSTDLLKGLASNGPVTWFSQKDKELLRFLIQGSVQKMDYLTRHRQMVRVILATNTSSPVDGNRDHCRAGVCALVRELTNLNEVAAFHLDRILGLNVSQPVVSHQLTSWLLPHQFTDGHARPVVRWDPGISLPQGANQYQDAYFARMVQYPSIFKLCGTKSNGVCHQNTSPELQKIKLLDYFLQEDEMLSAGSDHKKDRNSVTFVGLDWLPRTTLEVISSGCLPGSLVRSLYGDQEYWLSKSPHEVGNLVERIGKRANAFLKRIRERQRKKALV